MYVYKITDTTQQHPSHPHNSPVKPDSARLLCVHLVMVQKKPDHLVVSIASSYNERCGSLSGHLGHILQQEAGLDRGVVQQEGGQRQDSPLTGCFVHMSGQGLQPGQGRYLRHLCKIRPLIREQLNPPPIKKPPELNSLDVNTETLALW